ncbi:MAG: translation initiation factor [Bacteroidia bacterium]|nr:translation initiation factor [Bacteroidia bacterium]NNC85630.1 translation initiation factor [Bacteroidia bacterium]NNM15028.1 translation initiation factor [Bacteroidia bacterium]
MSKKKHKKAAGVVYSTNPDYNYEYSQNKEQETLASNQQELRVSIDRKQRAGKQVTLVTGFVGTEDDLKDLGKILKSKCGVGGSEKDGVIMIQGNFKEKIVELLIKLGYKTKGSGGN